MKVTEIKSIIEKYSQDQLRSIITQLYTAIPKAIKEEDDIDGLLTDPDRLTRSRSQVKQRVIPDIELLKAETDRFIEYACKQYYFIPNRFVSKVNRPKWRFIVKRLYKDLLLASGQKDVLPIAGKLLESLYQLLCYSCEIILFNGYDAFESIGIEQEEFYRRVLALKIQYEEKNVFIKNSLLLMINNSLNRCTLHEDLMRVILEFVKTTDLREMTIAKCDELIEIVKREPLSKKDERGSQYNKREKLNILAEMGFLCYAQLFEYQKAVSYFKKNYHNQRNEVTLYVLLRLLFDLNQKDCFLQEYETAIKYGITPRENLMKVYRFIKENDKFPVHFY
jgi:hypothetical protein